MATTETVLANLALLRMGQSVIDSIDGTDTLSVKVNILFDQARDEILTAGPELGWKFARHRYNCISQESFTITSIAQNSTDITVTAIHTLTVGESVELSGDTGYDGTYVVTAISTTVSFDVTATFVTTGTGTANWRSEEYQYRYLIPASPVVLRVVSASVGGIELTDWLEEGGYILTNMESDKIDLIFVQQITTTTKFPPHFTGVLVLQLAIQLMYNLTQDWAGVDRLERDLDLAMSEAIAMNERGKYVKEQSNAWADIGNTQDNIE